MVLAVSCSLDNDLQLDRSHELIGSWDWQMTEDWDPEYQYEQFDTPEIAGNEELLELKESGVFVKSVDGEAISQGEFYVFGEDSVRFYHHKQSEDFRYHVKSGYLTLENVADSGILVTYIKSDLK